MAPDLNRQRIDATLERQIVIDVLERRLAEGDITDEQREQLRQLQQKQLSKNILLTCGEWQQFYRRFIGSNQAYILANARDLKTQKGIIAGSDEILLTEIDERIFNLLIQRKTQL